MGLGGGGGTTPTPAPFVPINVGDVSRQALQADIQGYNLADADLAKRFPGLVSGRQQQIDSSYNELTGPLNPTVQNAFTTQGLEQSFGAFGGGNPMAKIGSGDTAASNAVATSLANNVQKKQDYDRTNFEGLLGYNPQRQFGLTGQDVASMYTANTIGQNAYNQQKYLGQIGASNASQAASQQQQQALIGVGTALASAAIIAF